jgi:hypothetical protein
LGVSWSGLESETAPGKGRRKKEFEEFRELQEFRMRYVGAVPGVGSQAYSG